MEKLIITVAVAGSGPMRENNPNIPYSPAEIADEIVRSCEAGASITHVHVRDPNTGAASFEMDYFREVRDRVRSRCDILLNFTTSSFNLMGENILEQRVGQRTTLDVLDAQQELLDAQVTQVLAQRGRVVAAFRLISAVGRLDETELSLPVARYDPTEHYEAVKDKWFGLRTPDGR